MDNPIIISFLLNVGYLVAGIIGLRLLIAWVNRSNATGAEFTFHDAIDKVFKNEMATAIFLAGCVVGLCILMSAFIRG